MSLPHDTARCVGRIGLGPDDPICDRRSQCARYQQMQRDRAKGLPDYLLLPVITHCWVDGEPTAFREDL